MMKHALNTLFPFRKRFTPEDFFASSDEDSIVLSKHLKLTASPHLVPGPRLTNNVVVFAGAGAGTSRCFISPNLENAQHNYVVTDFSGELYEKHAESLRRKGYNVRRINLVNTAESDFYNPFLYLKSERSVFELANTIVPMYSSCPFWPVSERILLSALMLYVWYTVPEQERTFDAVIDLLKGMKQDEDDGDEIPSPTDRAFSKLATLDPNNLAVDQYEKFKLGSGKVKDSIVVSLTQRLSLFKLPEIQRLLSSDTLHLEDFDNSKNALFIIVPACDSSFNVIHTMLYKQLVSTLTDVAESYGGGCHLHRHAQFITNPAMVDVPDVLHINRKYNISFSLITDSINSLAPALKNDTGIMHYFDAILCLGAVDTATLGYLKNRIASDYVYTWQSETGISRHPHLQDVYDTCMSATKNCCVFVSTGRIKAYISLIDEKVEESASSDNVKTGDPGAGFCF